MNYLEIRNLTMQFGGLTAVDDISINIKKGEIHGLIGPNGSGKTTIFNILSGYYKPTAGKIIFEGKDITGLPAHKITASGFARTFQNLRLFKSMTVLDNLLVAMGHNAKAKVYEVLINPMAAKNEDHAFTEKAMQLLGLLGIQKFAHDKATSLPYGNQRRVEIARALATEPKVLLLDEPAAGLNDVETEELTDILVRIHDAGVTIFLVEHHMKLVMKSCGIITVIDYGKKIAEGDCNCIQNDPVVIEAYLGKEDEVVSR